ncbi:glycosyltransferase family 4 protein [Leptolyngbya sp. BL0902]|uniref:glycosyltransferase family 4 protein n=1 Tax=Leptolyngbya sp. BL0902 TaxID=1115757 RepID=UPI0018E77549|nr:glycosyltransferase family 4 protein [Leptolyngbya sp. BL0902]
MSIAYVLKRYPRYSETFVVSEILAHEATGLEIKIFALRPPMDTHFQDIISRVKAPVRYLPSGAGRRTNFWQALQAAADMLPQFWSRLAMAAGEPVQEVYQAALLACEAVAQGITHFHAHFGTSATTVARLASHFTDIPYTFTAHAKDIFHETVQPDDLRRKLNDAAAVVTVSDYNMQYLRQQYGESAASVQRIYNGLDLEQFAYAEPRQRPPQILAVGRLVEKKGFGDLIKACGLLVQRQVEFRCNLVGTGELAAELQAQIEAANLQPWVSLVGPQPQREIKRWVQEAAVFAAPCVVGSDGNRDGLPTVLLEAMALGTPCVSTDVTGIPEVLQHEVTGLQVPQRDPVALALALERLLRDAHLRVSLATQARQQIEANFDIHTNAAQLRRVFRQVGGKTPRSQSPAAVKADSLNHASSQVSGSSNTTEPNSTLQEVR